MFLLNPNGMIFGSNAQLNIGGSFVASTANTVRFADGTDFSAKSPATTPVLTVSVPIGLQYGENAGSILNQSTAIGTGTFGSETVVGLQVQPGKTLALLGGDVVLEGGYLTAEAGRIELGSVAGASQVTLQPTEKGWTIGYEGVQNFQDIQLSQGVIVDASGAGGGDIYLQGRNITLTDASQVYSGTLGAGTGGIIAINAAESVLVNGGASITTFTEGTGRAGDMLVKANNSVELVGISPEGYITGLATQVCVISPDCGGVTGNNGAEISANNFGPGNGGTVNLNSRQLIIQNGGEVRARAFDSGSGGDLIVNATDSLEIAGTGNIDSESFASALQQIPGR